MYTNHQSSSSSLLESINNSSIVTGTCSRPNLPPTGRIRFASMEKVKFAENETIYILCEENQFPHQAQKRKCHHGRWLGKQARCGKAVVTKMNLLEATSCSELDQPLLLSVNLTQVDETPYPLPPNSFHFTRVPDKTPLSVIGSDCYHWYMQFEQPVEMQYLLIDINIKKEDSIKKDRPKIDIKIKNRKCQLEHTSYQVIEQDEIFGNYFFCDLYENITIKNNSDYNTTTATTTMMMLDDDIIKTDNLEMIIQIKGNRSVGLEAVFIGETYKKILKHLGNKSNIDCGKPEMKRTGVLEQIDLSHIKLRCNDSFIFLQTTSTTIFELLKCGTNGLWQGEFPVCTPKKTCSKSEIFDTLNPTIQLEQIGNVYWFNESEWFAIEHTWIHYTCSNFDGIMVGKSERTCRGGHWTNKVPHCTTALNSGSVTISIIIIILVILIAVFSLIVYLSIRAHGKKINRKLESAKYELEEKALNKQISASSDGYYSDIGLETIYEDCKEIYTVPDYEMAEDIRYDIDPARRIQPKLLPLPFSSSSSQQQQQQPSNRLSEQIQYQSMEPEYLAMTEGTLNRPKTRPPLTPTYYNDDVYE
nr:uncharacterized protein LOC124493676 [Dermatophagoides farinae]